VLQTQWCNGDVEARAPDLQCRTLGMFMRSVTSLYSLLPMGHDSPRPRGPFTPPAHGHGRTGTSNGNTTSNKNAGTSNKNAGTSNKNAGTSKKDTDKSDRKTPKGPATVTK
jgi:hypothetical protein